MWVRQWLSRTTKANSESYLTYLHTVAVPLHEAASGNVTTYVLRLIGQVTDEFMLFSHWHSYEAMQIFARDDGKAITLLGNLGYQLETGTEVLVYQAFDIDDYRLP